jgi:hypothetical protein
MGRSESSAGLCTKRFVEITDNTGTRILSCSSRSAERTGTGLQSQPILKVQNPGVQLSVQKDIGKAHQRKGTGQMSIR